MDDYYVYALKDPRENPARPFYIGKGVGARARSHLASPDRSRKGQRIRSIQASGAAPIVTIIVSGLAEDQALQIESELIASFGTEDTGGLLTNTVIPGTVSTRQRSSLTVPQGAIERAQLGLGLLKDAVVELAKANPGGVTNSEVASVLGLRSDYRGKQKDYLGYSLLGLLLSEGRLRRPEASKKHVSPPDAL